VNRSSLLVLFILTTACVAPAEGTGAKRTAPAETSQIEAAAPAAAASQTTATTAAGNSAAAESRSYTPAPHLLREPVATSAEVITAMERGLGWLARHQSADGSWNPASFDEHCVDGLTQCVAAGSEWSSAGATALALLALQGSGSTDHQGRYRENVKGGLKFLIENQKRSGAYANAQQFFGVPDHVLSTLAVLEAYVLTQKFSYKKSARRALEHLATLQLPSGGFPSTHVTSEAPDLAASPWAPLVLLLPGASPTALATLGQHDQVTSCWALLTLLMAHEKHVSGTHEEALTRLLGSVRVASQGVYADWSLPTPQAEIGRAATLMAMQWADPYKTFEGAQSRHESALTSFADLVYRFPEDTDWAMPRKPSLQQTGVFWYFAAHVFHQWKQSYPAESRLLATQLSRGCTSGSWPPAPTDDWPASGGAVASTALAVLTLQVPQHFLRVTAP